MPEHVVCNKEVEIAEIHRAVNETKAICERLDEGLRGNGKPGLFTEFAVWKNTVAGLVALDIIIVGGLVALWFKG